MKKIRNFRGIRLALCASMAAALTACGNHTLDYRNAQVNNGKVYAGDSNTPFTGTLTNVSSSAILNGQKGYARVADVDFLTNPICDVRVKDGVLDGDAKCSLPRTDIVAMKMSFKGGALDGDFLMFDKTGEHHIVEAHFRDGVPDGKSNNYSPDTYKLVHLTRWDNGVRSGDDETFDPNTGNPLVRKPYVNGKLDGEVQQYAPNGEQLVHRLTYVNGVKQGQEDAYDAGTGKHTAHAEWDNDKLNGEMIGWDLQGNVVKHITYDHGTDVEVEKRQAIAKQQAEEAQQAINDPAISGCVDQLSRAYLTEQGNTAYVPAEKTLAFRDQCRQSALAARATAVMSSQTAASSASPATVSDGVAAKRCGWIDKAGGVVLHDREGYWIIESAGGRPAEGYENMPKVGGQGSSYCGCLTVEANRQAMQITKIVAGNVLPASSCEQDRSLK